MYRNKLTRRFLALSAALSLALCQSAFAGETVELNLDDAMQRAFQTNPTVSIAQYELDSARASYNAARQSRGVSISANHTTQRGGADDDQYVSRLKGIDATGNLLYDRVNAGKGISNKHSKWLNCIPANFYRW